MPTDEERFELIAARLESLFKASAAVTSAATESARLLNEHLDTLGLQQLHEQPQLDLLQRELTKVDDARQKVLDQFGQSDAEPMELSLSPEFFYTLGVVSYKTSRDIKDYRAIMQPLGELITDKEYRQAARPLFFSWSIVVLEKLALLMDKTGSSSEYIEWVDLLLNSLFYYLYERTDIKPPLCLIDNALRIMSSCNPTAYRPKYWPSYLRIFVTRCLKTREIPFSIQERCYKVTQAAAYLLGDRFWTTDEQFVRVLAAMCTVHWRLMLEGLADRAALVTTFSIFSDIFEACEERSRISDQTAICVANNCKQMMEAMAGYVKGEAQNPVPLTESEHSIVADLLSILVNDGALHMIAKEDEEAIIDWWLSRSLTLSPVFRQLMMCSQSIDKLDARVVSALAAYYERCVTGDVPAEETERMSIEWVMQMISEKRTDFYDRETLSDCVARLERVRLPKKYLDQLKALRTA